MTAADAIAKSRSLLFNAGIPDAALEAQVLAMHAAGWTRARLLASLRDPLPPEAAGRMEAALLRRLAREPLAYITGHREFFGLDFMVDPRVLVPRQETECLVEHVIALAPGRPIIADVGTGSGAIAVGLAVSLPQARVIATDASPGALDVAALNAARHGVADRIALFQGDLLAPIAEPVDIAAANLPYVREAEWEGLQPEIRLYEPKEALLAGPDGLQVVTRLLEQVAGLHQKPAWVVLELGEGQAEEVVRRAGGLLPLQEAQVYRDLARLERGVALRLAKSG